MTFAKIIGDYFQSFGKGYQIIRRAEFLEVQYLLLRSYTCIMHVHFLYTTYMYMYFPPSLPVLHACTYPLLCTCMMHVHVSYTLYMYNVHVQCVGWIFIRELDHDSPIFQFCYWNFCVFGKSVMT